MKKVVVGLLFVLISIVLHECRSKRGNDEKGMKKSEKGIPLLDSFLERKDVGIHQDLVIVSISVILISKFLLLVQ
jgi:hypothetical protein